MDRQEIDREITRCESWLKTNQDAFLPIDISFPFVAEMTEKMLTKFPLLWEDTNATYLPLEFYRDTMSSIANKCKELNIEWKSVQRKEINVLQLTQIVKLTASNTIDVPATLEYIMEQRGWTIFIPHINKDCMIDDSCFYDPDYKSSLEYVQYELYNKMVSLLSPFVELWKFIDTILQNQSEYFELYCKARVAIIEQKKEG